MEGCNSESETTAEPNDSSDEELVEKFTNTLTTEDFKEQKTGEWIPQDLHSWGSENKPDPNLKLDNTVAISLTHPIVYTIKMSEREAQKPDRQQRANKVKMVGSG